MRSVAGTVQQVAVHTEGGVVTPAQVLMVIVPKDSEVTAEVVIDNKDIGFVNAGDTARIKLETFPYTRYGRSVAAKVKSVTADAVNDDKKGAIFPATPDAGPLHHQRRWQVDQPEPRDERHGRDQDRPAPGHRLPREPDPAGYQRKPRQESLAMLSGQVPKPLPLLSGRTSMPAWRTASALGYPPEVRQVEA